MKIKDILKANICALGETIFDEFSLDDDDFIEALDFYITNNNFESRLEDYAYRLEYDTDDITNVLVKIKIKNKEYEYLDTMNCCRCAYIKTITIDKTINVEALIDNLINEFKKIDK